MTSSRGRTGGYCRWHAWWLIGNESTTHDISIIRINLCNIILQITVAAWISCVVTRSNTASTVLDVWVWNIFTAGEYTILCRVSLDCK